MSLRSGSDSRPRLTIATLMGLILAVACAIAALRYASPAVFAVLACGTLLLLLTAVVGASVGRQRAAWLGFAVFGWGFASAAWAFSILDAVSNEPNTVRAWPSMVSPYTPLADLFMLLYPYVHGAPPAASINGVAVPAARTGVVYASFQWVAHDVACLIFAATGAMVGKAFARRSHASSA